MSRSQKLPDVTCFSFDLPDVEAALVLAKLIAEKRGCKVEVRNEAGEIVEKISDP